MYLIIFLSLVHLKVALLYFSLNLKSTNKKIVFCINPKSVSPFSLSHEIVFSTLFGLIFPFGAWNFSDPPRKLLKKFGKLLEIDVRSNDVKYICGNLGKE